MRVLLAQPFQRLPGEPCLVVVRRRAPARGRLVALGEIALAPPVPVEIDGEAQRLVAAGDGPLDVILDPGVVAADVELEQLGVRIAGRHRLDAGRARRAQHVQHAGARGGLARRHAALRREILQRADRRQDHRQFQLQPQQRAARVDMLDVAQHARPEGDGVERDAIALLRGLRLRAADDVVPRALGHVALGQRHELMENGIVHAFLHPSVPRISHAPALCPAAPA